MKTYFFSLRPDTITVAVSDTVVRSSMQYNLQKVTSFWKLRLPESYQLGLLPSQTNFPFSDPGSAPVIDMFADYWRVATFVLLTSVMFYRILQAAK